MQHNGAKGLFGWVLASLLICSSRRGCYTCMSTQNMLCMSIFAIKLLYENNEKNNACSVLGIHDSKSAQNMLSSSHA
jgi:hypothetical protein